MKEMLRGVLLGALLLPRIAQAQDTEALAKQVQNPVASLISVPFQNNFNFGVGPGNDLEFNLNIQPVLPFKLNHDWNFISPTISPLIYQPVLGPGVGDVIGLGDIQKQLYLSLAKASSFIWGASPVFQFPTATYMLSARANGTPAPAESRSSRKALRWSVHWPITSGPMARTMAAPTSTS